MLRQPQERRPLFPEQAEDRSQTDKQGCSHPTEVARIHATACFLAIPSRENNVLKSVGLTHFESLSALYVRKAEMTLSRITGNQAASTGSSFSVSLSFLQLILLMMKKVKKMIDTSSG